MLTSALEGRGIEEVADAVAAHHDHMTTSGQLAVLRRQQDLQWLHDQVVEGLLTAFRADPASAAALDQAAQSVRAGTRSPTRAAQDVLRTAQRS